MPKKIYSMVIMPEGGGGNALMARPFRVDFLRYPLPIYDIDM